LSLADKRKLVAWGKGTLLGNWINSHPQGHGISYIVDSFQKKSSEYMGVPVHPLDVFKKEDLRQVLPVLFPVNSRSRREVRLLLNSLGLSYGTGYIDSSDLFKNDFMEKASRFLGREIDSRNYDLARSHDNNSYVPVETTVCGSWLLLECLQDTLNVEGPIAEIGAYRGGNAVLMQQAMSLHKDSRPYFILDSFSGFPQMHEYDPHVIQEGYTEEYNLREIHDRFSMFENVKIIQGFVPETFRLLPQSSKYSLIFFDCDLYEPAAATLDYFWDKLSPGGYILIHDYIHTIYGGVTRAVDEFCKKRNLELTVFFESTMACLKK
jgi:hypothetical protein